MLTKILLFLAVASTPLWAQFSYRNVELVRVVDGDTVRLTMEIAPDLWIHDKPCRLLRIDAPERGRPGSEQARAALEKLLAGKALSVEVKRADHFGRYLVELTACGAARLRQRLGCPAGAGARQAEIERAK